MDNLCHTLVGSAIGHAGLRTRTRFAQATLMVSANIPDIDVLTFVVSSLPSVGFRRGWTHGVLAQAVLPLVVAAAVIALDRFRPAARDSRAGPPLRRAWVVLLAYVGVYSHVGLDWLNNYGVRLLTPFDWRWFYGDAVFIIDLALWLSLGAGVWLARRRRSVRPARWAGAIALTYVLALVVSAQAARGIVTDRWRADHGMPPRALMVGPVPVTPLTRVVIADAGAHYAVGTFDWRTRAVAWEADVVPKHDTAPEVAAAKRDPEVSTFLVWSRFPFWIIEPLGDGRTRVTVGDVRFMDRMGGFTASAVIEAPRGS